MRSFSLLLEVVFWVCSGSASSAVLAGAMGDGRCFSAETGTAVVIAVVDTASLSSFFPSSCLAPGVRFSGLILAAGYTQTFFL